MKGKKDRGERMERSVIEDSDLPPRAWGMVKLKCGEEWGRAWVS